MPRRLAPFEAILRDELNVKSVDLVRARRVERRGLRHHQAAERQRPCRGPAARQGGAAGDPGGAGRRLGARRRRGRRGRHRARAGRVRPRARGRRSADGQSALALLADGGFVILDTATTPELEAEGLARDIVRAVQDARKAAGLEVGDRIGSRSPLDAESRACRRGPRASSSRARRSRRARRRARSRDRRRRSASATANTSPAARRCTSRLEKA